MASVPAEPSDGDVSQLMEFTGMMRSDAVRYLKAKKEVNAAAMAFFDGEDISKIEQSTQWDESAWTTDRDGGNADQTLRPLGVSSAAATRPNSPAPSTSGRSNLHPSSKQEEDDDLARAMAMSQGELGDTYQQETGRIGADGQQQTQFGPATREHYEANQWAMVPTGVHNAHEIVPDLEPQQRVQTIGEPRVLKYLATGDYTPNLLTICHAINGAREGMLMRDYLQISYGEDADWWKGHAIVMPRVVHVEDGSAAEPDSDKDDNLLAEVQRLMAFLSASDRSYASVGALTQMDAMKESRVNTQSNTLLEHFLQKWTQAACSKSEHPQDIVDLFNTTIGTNVPEGTDTRDNMSLIDIPVNIPQDTKSDLLEQLDERLWGTKSDSATMSDNYIERPAEVLVMRIHQQNPTSSPQLGLEIPVEFHVDKYLSANIGATRATRTHIADSRKRISKIDEIEKKLMTWKHPKKNETIDAGLLLRHAHGHYSGKNRADILNADKTNNVNEEAQATNPEHEDIAQRLETIISSIENKLKVLADEKEKTRKAIAEMSKAPPAGLQPEDLKFRYTLRGVATNPNITYVLYPSITDAEDEMVDDDVTPRGMQWWRMEYKASNTSPVLTKTKSAGFDVIRAVELEHSSALLVYASDVVTNPLLHNPTLPGALQEFVERDNAFLAAELQQQISTTQAPPAYDFSDAPRESIEPRSSMDSTRVEGGGSSDIGAPSPPDYEDADFMGHPSFGLGHDIKTGYRISGEDSDDAPVHEIKLDTPEDEGVDVGTEMVEKPHGRLFDGAGTSDTVMEDAGIGGKSYVEEAEER